MVTAGSRLGAGARITGEARELLASQVGKRYVAGESIRAIAVDLGRSYGFVQTLLVETGVSLRTRGGDTRSPAARQRRATVAQRTTSITPTSEVDPTRMQSLEVQQMVAEPVAEIPEGISKPEKGKKSAKKGKASKGEKPEKLKTEKVKKAKADPKPEKSIMKGGKSKGKGKASKKKSK